MAGSRVLEGMCCAVHSGVGPSLLLAVSVSLQCPGLSGSQVNSMCEAGVCEQGQSHAAP